MKNVQHACLGCLNDSREGLTVFLKFDQGRLCTVIVIPDVMVNGLKVPDDFAGCAAQRDD